MTGSELVLAAGLDLIMGDPRWLPHPVRAMGQVIAWCDDHVREICRSPLCVASCRRHPCVGAADGGLSVGALDGGGSWSRG